MFSRIMSAKTPSCDAVRKMEPFLAAVLQKPALKEEIDLHLLSMRLARLFNTQLQQEAIILSKKGDRDAHDLESTGGECCR